jgi:hypothetical protein
MPGNEHPVANGIGKWLDSNVGLETLETRKIIDPIENLIQVP